MLVCYLTRELVWGATAIRMLVRLQRSRRVEPHVDIRLLSSLRLVLVVVAGVAVDWRWTELLWQCQLIGTGGAVPV
ncbi:MAG TPA: hypothetical protein VKP30_32355, partial [Polyangiaceae bacterium]|nr:hypothetical protein [Polyangiaceae bacterium]